MFDVMKDAFGISRAIRRQFTNKEKGIEGFEDIKMSEDYIDIELIAIYR